MTPIYADPSEFFEAFVPDVSEQELQARIRSPKVRLVFRPLARQPKRQGLSAAKRY